MSELMPTPEQPRKFHKSEALLFDGLPRCGNCLSQARGSFESCRCQSCGHFWKVLALDQQDENPFPHLGLPVVNVAELDITPRRRTRHLPLIRGPYRRMENIVPKSEYL